MTGSDDDSWHATRVSGNGERPHPTHRGHRADARRRCEHSSMSSQMHYIRTVRRSAVAS